MKRARGYTLIELSVGLGILGLVLVAVWRFGFVANQRIAEAEIPPALTIAEEALLGFAAARHRLPCPDANRDGLEDCAASTGVLPVLTLGLARAGMGQIRYGIYRGATTNAALDADLASALDRFHPLLTLGTPPTALRTPLGSVGGIDFCTALSNAGGAIPNPDLLTVRDRAGTVLRNAAYALALPGATDANADGDIFDGPASGTGFAAAPSQSVSVTYDDTVRVADFTQLFERLSCASTLAAAGHAHPNTASGAAILSAAMSEYQVQLELASETAGAKVAGATAGVASAAAGVSSAAATMLIAVSQTLVSQGALAGIVAAGSAAVAANSVATVVSTATLGVAIAGKVLADKRVEEFQPLRVKANELAVSIRSNAGTADSADMYR